MGSIGLEAYTPNNQDAVAAVQSVQKARSNVLHRSLREPPSEVVSASGNYLTLTTGQKIFDATGGAAVSCIGHGDSRVKQAIAEQLSQVDYCHSLFFGCRSAEKLADLLVASTQGHMSRSFIVSSGSEAMEAAMKMARQYFLELEPKQTSRTRFIARRESYHGNTLGALSMSGHLSRRALFEPILMPNVSHVSQCNAYRGMKEGESDEKYVARLADELEQEFQRVGPQNVCAFVAEPVVGAALGCVPAVTGYFQAMRAVCDRYGALLILDEVMSGMGRTGTLHAWEQEGVVPDMQTIGKGLGGGYASIAGLLLNHRIVDVLDRGTGMFSHGQTYQGHPLACAAALRVQEIVIEDQLVQNVNSLGPYLGESLQRRLANHPHVGNVRGRGFFWGIEFVADRTIKEPFDPVRGIAMAIHHLGMQAAHSISLYPGTGTKDGKTGDHVLVAPAYNVSKAELDEIVDKTCKVIETFFDQIET